jgi:hypothetical protein
MKVRFSGLLIVLIMALASGCITEQAPADQLFPAQVSSFVRTTGPNHDPQTNVEQSTYESTDGRVTLRVRQVGKENVSTALATLPPGAENVGYDPMLGQRDGVLFTYAGEYHAAWGNGDWVFILSASTDLARVNFLASFGY